jgi:hypothetical protein
MTEEMFQQQQAYVVVQQVGGDEPPTSFSAQLLAAVRECLQRSSIPVGGGRSPRAFSVTQEGMNS